MASYADRLGVQSFCFRAFKDNAVVAEKVKEIGVSRIELCAVHVDFQDTDKHAEVIRTYEDAGVEICAVGVEKVKDELSFRNVAAFAKAAGAKNVSVDFPIDTIDSSLEVGQKLAEEYDLLLGIHNHGGYHWLGNMQAIDWVLGKAGDRIGMHMDTAWALDAKQDPVEMIRKYGKKMFAVHLKDFIFDKARNQTDVSVGDGNIDVPAIKAALDEIGFDGPPVIEYEGDVDNPVPALTKCVQNLKAVL